MKTVRQSSICFSIMSWGLLENIEQWRCSVFSIRCHHKSQLLCLISESGPHILQSNTKHTICLHQYTYRLKIVLVKNHCTQRVGKVWALLVKDCSDNFAKIKLNILPSGIGIVKCAYKILIIVYTRNYISFLVHTIMLKCKKTV